MKLRDLRHPDDLRRVVELEKLIWGYGDADDLVGVPVLAATLRRGAILVGAFDGQDTLVGFVYSMPSLRAGRPAQWSHMLGVLAEHRSAGVGLRLKLEQRRRALAMGLDLVEWTYDPLQAVNAHFNFNKLGIVASEYEENIYGESSSPLHRGGPTDRLVAEWWIGSPEVARRLEGGPPPLPTRTLEEVRPLGELASQGTFWRCRWEGNLPRAPVVAIDIPMDFPAIQRDAPELAMDWRLVSRALFTEAFAAGYRAVAFLPGAPHGTGRYVLGRDEQGAPR